MNRDIHALRNKTHTYYWASQVAVIKNPSADAEDARDVGQKDPLKKEMATPVFLPG